MHLSRQKKYSRIYLFRMLLIVMSSFIILRFLQQTKYCRSWEVGDRVSLKVAIDDSPVVYKKLTVKNFPNTEIVFVNKSLDLSRLDQVDSWLVTGVVSEKN